MSNQNEKTEHQPKTVIGAIRKGKQVIDVAPEVKAKRNQKKNGCLGGFMYFLFIFCVALVIAFLGWMAASDVLSLNKGDFETTVTLPEKIFSVEGEGEGAVSHCDVKYVSEELHNAGLVHYRWLFEKYCAFSNADTKFDPGEYELKSSYDYRALVQHMQFSSGPIGTVSVLIPEGFTMEQIFRRFDEEGVASYEDLIDSAANANFKYSFLNDEQIGNANRLEGFLFPDTYEFYIGMEASSAINKLLSTFYYKLNQDMYKQAENLGYNLYDIIKVASIIEREAKFDEDRAATASVIYNRLRDGWQLGLDSTILYLYPDHEGEPTQDMIDEDTPYNTRLHRGLPPTPISNPGMKSIEAALNPEQSNYYYFASDESGHLHFFADSYSFNQFVEEQLSNES